MKKDPKVFLRHVLESIAAIEEYTAGLSEEDFLGDRKTQDATVRRLEVIGEAVRNLPEETRQLTSDVAWRQIMAMRNILIHVTLWSGPQARLACHPTRPTPVQDSRRSVASRRFIGSLLVATAADEAAA